MSARCGRCGEPCAHGFCGKCEVFLTAGPRDDVIKSPWCTRKCVPQADAVVQWDRGERKDRATCLTCRATGHLTLEVCEPQPRLADGGQDSPADPHKGALEPEDGTPADTPEHGTREGEDE